MAVGKVYKYSGQEGVNQFSPVTYAIITTANTEKTLSVPFLTSSQSNSSAFSNKTEIIAIIRTSGAGTTTMNVNATVSTPTSSFASGTGIVAPPGLVIIKKVQSDDVLHFISTTSTVYISVEFYLSN